MLVALLALAPSSRAESSPLPAPSPRVLVLSWEAPPECPPRAEVEARIERILAGSHRADAIDARVTIVRTRDARWSARLSTQIRGVAGERTLSAASCDLLASASALVIALAIDPDLDVEPPEEPARSAPAPVPVASTKPEVVAAPSSQPPRVNLVTGAWLAGDSGSLPSLALGGGAGIGIERGHWSIEAYVETWLGSTVSSPDRAGAGGRFDLIDFGLRACARGGAFVTYGACLGAEVDRAHASGFGVSDPGAATRAWLAPRAGLELGLRVADSVHLPLHLEALVPIPRPMFALENVGPVFRPAAVGLRATFGAVVHF